MSLEPMDRPPILTAGDRWGNHVRSIETFAVPSIFSSDMQYISHSSITSRCGQHLAARRDERGESKSGFGENWAITMHNI
jgi:hypothetical protein